MKTNKYLNIAASVLMLAACAKEELVPSEELIPVSESTTVTFVATDGTKTVLGGDLKTTSWDKKENVLLWEGETSLIISDDDKSYSEDGKKLTITKEVASPESTFYSIIGPEGEDNVTRTSATVLDTQNPKPTSFDPNAEILVAQPATCGEGNTVALRYNRPVAITVATLKNLEADEKVLSVKITANENLTGKVNFTYEGSSVKAAMVGTGNTITCNYTTNNTVVKGEKDEDGYIFPVYFISLNADVMGFEFEVCTDKHKYYRKITRPEGSPIILNDNRVAQFGFKLENADKADAEGDKFVKVTSTDELTDGDYLIVYETGNVALNGALTADQAANTVSVTISNNEITSTDAISAAVVTYDSSDGSLLGTGGKYIGHTGSKNTLNYSDSALENDITFDKDGNAIITAGNYVMKFNKASDQARFRYYTSDQEDIQLYKKAAGGYGKYTLATPKNIKAGEDGKSIVWDAVENAGKYSVSYTGTDLTVGESGTVSTVVEGCIIEDVTPDYYSVTVQALPKDDDENYQESAVSAPTDITLGTPTLKKPEIATKFSTTTSSITITWTADARATNGFTSWITTVVAGEGGKEETGEQVGEKQQIASGAEKTVTFENLKDNTSYRVFVQAKAVTTPKVYAESPSTYKTIKTAAASTIKAILDTDITGAGATFAVEDAQIIAFGTSVCWLKDNTGAILAQVGIPTDAKIGDHVSISGTVDSNHRFNNQSIITFKEEGSYSEPSPVAVLDAAGMESRLTNFTAGEYVKYAGSIDYAYSYYRVNVGSKDAIGTLFATDLVDLSTVEYATITGYMTYISGKYLYTIATEIVENTLDISATELTWEASATGQKSITITSDNANWNFAPTDNSEWNISKNGNTLNVSPVSANTSIDKKELTVTLTHATNTQLTKEIKLSQNGKVATYEKVASVNDLSDGDVIVLAYESGNKAAGPMGSNAYFSSEDATINNGVLTSPNAIPITLGNEGDNWTLSISGSKVGATAAKSLSTTGGTTTWTISISNGNASITSTTASYGTIKYNTQYPRFLNYASGQTAIQIYKLQKSIVSVEVSGAPTKKTYEVGDAFVPAGLTVTAHYDDGTSNTVSSDVDWNVTPSSMTKGLTSVSVTATYKGVTSAQYVVNGLTVNERQQYTVTLGDDSTKLSADDNGDVTLPTRTATTSGHSFVGWSTENLTEATKTSPSIIPAGKYRPSSNITLYPVYKYTVSESSGSASYNVTTTLTAGKKYIFGAVKAAANTTLANNTTFGAVAFTNTFDAQTPNWGNKVDLTPEANGKIAADNKSITDACIWTLESITNGNYALKNKDGNYLHLGNKIGGTSNGAQSGISQSASCFLENVSSTCKDAFLFHPTSTSTKIMLYNTGYGYRMYEPRTYSATMTPYVRFYEYTEGSVDVDYYTVEK